MYLLLKKLSFSTAGCLGFWCHPFLVYQNAKSLNTSALGYAFLACLNPLHVIPCLKPIPCWNPFRAIPAVGLRSTTRAKYNIEVGV